MPGGLPVHNERHGPAVEGNPDDAQVPFAGRFPTGELALVVQTGSQLDTYVSNARGQGVPTGDTPCVWDAYGVTISADSAVTLHGPSGDIPLSLFPSSTVLRYRQGDENTIVASAAG